MFGMMCNLLRNNGGHFHSTVTPAIADGSEEFPSFFPFFSLFFFFIFLLFSLFRLSGLEFWLSCDVLASSLQVPELRLHNVSSCNTMAIPCEIVSLHPPIMYGHHEATFSSPASVATFLAKLASPRLLETCRTRTINLRPHIPCNHFADSDGTQVCSFPVRVVVFFVLLFTNQSAGVPANVSSVPLRLLSRAISLRQVTYATSVCRVALSSSRPSMLSRPTPTSSHVGHLCHLQVFFVFQSSSLQENSVS